MSHKQVTSLQKAFAAVCNFKEMQNKIALAALTALITDISLIKQTSFPLLLPFLHVKSSQTPNLLESEHVTTSVEKSTTYGTLISFLEKINPTQTFYRLLQFNWVIVHCMYHAKTHVVYFTHLVKFQ